MHRCRYVYDTVVLTSSEWHTTCICVCLQDVARFCNRYPNIDLAYEVEDKDNICR